MNPLSEFKKKLAPRSRWGAISLAPRREFGGLTWSEAENRPQPQDGALINDSFIADEPEVLPLPKLVSMQKPVPVQKVAQKAEFAPRPVSPVSVEPEIRTTGMLLVS